MFSLFKKKEISILAPIEGKTISIEKVNDQVFAQKLVGDGIAIIPTGNVLKAPCDGLISLITETKHAFSIEMENGIQILVHFGLDTVALKGKGFDVLEEQGKTVKAGTPIIKVDIDFLKSKNIDLSTPVLIVNVDKTKKIECIEEKTVTNADEVLKVYL